ncbi:MAG: CYTH domain-containing protein [Clostridia bacterium]|nr:CYTH domain-containing protein [Clostridia bacterium]
MIELEKKILLTEHEYFSLRKYFGKKSMVTQINFYFDTDDLSMNQQNITCRIRLKDGKCNATMKYHSSMDESSEVEMKIRNGLQDNTFLDMGLRCQGELVTKRCVLIKDATYEVVLDKNEYLGTTDYELEIEYLPNCEHNATKIIKYIAEILENNSDQFIEEFILRTYQVKSKSKRFFERKKKLQLWDEGHSVLCQARM